MDQSMDTSIIEQGRSVEARDFGLGVPVIFTIGWLVVAYFMVYFFVAYISPPFFGTRPPTYGPFWGRDPWGYGRHNRHKRTTVPIMDNVISLTGRVLKAIEDIQ